MFLKKSIWGLKDESPTKNSLHGHAEHTHLPGGLGACTLRNLECSERPFGGLLSNV